MAVFTIMVIKEEKPFFLFFFPGKQNNTHGIGKQQEIRESYKKRVQTVLACDFWCRGISCKGTRRRMVSLTKHRRAEDMVNYSCLP